MNTPIDRIKAVSVVVATRDRPGDLARCLPTILANDWDDFEVVVVDQSASGETAKLVAALDDDRLHYVKHDGKGKSLALNYALPMVRGEIIAFTDDDCTVPDTWLADSVRVFEREPDAGLLFGAFEATGHDSDKSFVPTFLPKRYRRIRGRLHRTHFLGVGGNMAARRSTFERIGGFENHLGPGGRFRTGEDCELAYRALKAGYTVVQDPSIVVTHWGEREYHSGAVRRLIGDAYFAIGAGYGVHARQGDLAAASLVAGETALLLSEVAVRAARRQAPLGFRRLTSFLMGAWAGLRQGSADGG